MKVYLDDDILMKSQTRHQDAEDVKIVFKSITEFEFKISETKCALFMSRIKYLGQVIDKKDQRPRSCPIKRN